jgi:hypothetical protein
MTIGYQADIRSPPAATAGAAASRRAGRHRPHVRPQRYDTVVGVAVREQVKPPDAPSISGFR